MPQSGLFPIHLADLSIGNEERPSTSRYSLGGVTLSIRTVRFKKSLQLCSIHFQIVQDAHLTSKRKPTNTLAPGWQLRFCITGSNIIQTALSPRTDFDVHSSTP